MASWKGGLFGCFGDCGVCMLTFLVPCVSFGKTAETAGMGSCAMYGLLYFIPLVNLIMITKTRTKVRESKGIEGSGGGDCVATLLCPLCVMMQMGREVKNDAPGGQTMSRTAEAPAT